ncbi:MAG: VRR-NUC domain-containing protein [Pelosinus sp.]|nr:VRR-NUC domain-containing protein [Pelosinus sp.]
MAEWFGTGLLKESEKAIKRQIKAFLQYRGWFVFHILQGVGSYKGVSDFIAVKEGRVLFIEVKTTRGRQSEVQLQFEADIGRHGGEYLLARSLEDVAKGIERVS